MLRRVRRLWDLSCSPAPEPRAALIAEGALEWGEHSYSHGEPIILVWRSPVAGRLGGAVRVGRYCSLASGVTFLTGGNHRLDWVSTFPFRARWGLPGQGEDGHPVSNGDITVGNDVWIGQDALILSGVTIGDGAAIAARAVVTRDVRPYAVVGGNPAREVRRRFTDEHVELLLSVRWWDWPEAKVRRNVHLLCSPAVEGLLSAT